MPREVVLPLPLAQDWSMSPSKPEDASTWEVTAEEETEPVSPGQAKCRASIAQNLETFFSFAGLFILLFPSPPFSLNSAQILSSKKLSAAALKKPRYCQHCRAGRGPHQVHVQSPCLFYQETYSPTTCFLGDLDYFSILQ